MRRTVEHTAPAHAASLGGVISTVTQLAIVVGVAGLGTLYPAAAPMAASLAPLTWVLLATTLAAVLTSAALLTFERRT